MEFVGSVVRWRRQQVDNPYNPDRTEWGPWSGAVQTVLEGASVLSSSAYALRAEGRDQALSMKSLFLDDPLADVQLGDGISLAPGGDAPEFQVVLVPNADVNPFTGWQPVREVPLKGVAG